MAFPLLEFGGSGPVLHWAPANGFPPDTYRPVLERLRSRCRVVCLPPRALWPGAGEPPAAQGSWTMLADDLAAGLAAHGLDDVILAGHSFGAVASLLVAVRHRPRVRALALLDPTILPPAMMDAFREAGAGGWSSPHPLAGRARERRADFGGPDEAFATWRERRLFADWSDAALRGYVEAMLVRRPDGAWTLRWTPAWEAWYYEAFYADTWDDVARLDPALPLLVAGGGRSDTFLPDAAEHLRRLVPGAEMATVPGGHLFPHSHPGETADLLEAWLDRVLVPEGAP